MSLGELFQATEGEGRRPEEIKRDHTFPHVTIIVNVTWVTAQGLMASAATLC